jgi:hypothetical protein
VPNKPLNVYVDCDRASCKVMINPLALVSSLGFNVGELREVERFVIENRTLLLSAGSSFMAKIGERVMNVSFTDINLTVEIEDGRSISVPVGYSPSLFHASKRDRDNCQVTGRELGICLPAIDEDLSMQGLLREVPAPHVRIVSS